MAPPPFHREIATQALKLCIDRPTYASTCRQDSILKAIFAVLHHREFVSVEAAWAHYGSSKHRFYEWKKHYHTMAQLLTATSDEGLAAQAAGASMGAGFHRNALVWVNLVPRFQGEWPARISYRYAPPTADRNAAHGRVYEVVYFGGKQKRENVHERILTKIEGPPLAASFATLSGTAARRPKKSKTQQKAFDSAVSAMIENPAAGVEADDESPAEEEEKEDMRARKKARKKAKAAQPHEELSLSELLKKHPKGTPHNPSCFPIPGVTNK